MISLNVEYKCLCCTVYVFFKLLCGLLEVCVRAATHCLKTSFLLKYNFFNIL